MPTKTKSDYERILFLVISPILALLIIAAGAGEITREAGFDFLGVQLHRAPLVIFLIFLTQGHVFLIFQRSMANREVFNRFKMKILIGTATVMSLAIFSNFFFLLFTFVNIFWLQHHFMMQNFGVNRLLGKSELLQSRGRRWMDLVFVFVTFFAPVLNSAPQIMFDPQSISSILLKINGISYIHGVMVFLEFAIKTAIALETPILILSFAYIGYLFKNETRLKAVFALSLMLGSWLPWLYFDPQLAIGVYILLHSIQYYYLVAKTSDVGASKKNSFIFLGWVAAALLFGSLYPFFASKEEITMDSNFNVRALNGFLAAVNLLHFWMDGFVWKRISMPVVQEQVESAI